MILYAKVSSIENGYESDQRAAKALVNDYGILTIFEVEKVYIDRSSSQVKLLCEDVKFNTVNFDFFIETEKGPLEYDIFKNPLKLRCIEYNYINMVR
ncbi:hypothetical protein G2469_00148 [Escherichia phage vB_EcoM_G2469]|uniref:Uncharacterized protein n=1 Tax=Escherichia phage vB_EcoM_G2469 TaxID=2502415 RepID=A0A482GAZ1_9CAUD|nr:hypothetical protein G2469_00148 [Escherichia phage vB_EcoM_G2469]WPK33820.1 hypothetical protein [Escherichia phage AV109]WPK35136.1 hypothetical protein [Escherichia phage AV114]WPK35395.1 hypothetical protein [Escherichia phage AV115]WPK35657.1 hypothetical protein [Escherichia phage AV116]WPK36188.1 hypothetical protein [Escherichia phage AV118]